MHDCVDAEYDQEEIAKERADRVLSPVSCSTPEVSQCRVLLSFATDHENKPFFFDSLS